MRTRTETPKTNQKTFLMIGGVIVIGTIIWWYMKKRREDQGTGAQLPREGEFIPVDHLSEDDISRKYAMDTWGISSEVADEVVSKGNWILTQPDGNWYKQTVRHAQERGRDVPTQSLHEAFWVINEPNRMREYAQTTWGRNYDEAEEIRVYAIEKVKASKKWHEDATVKAKERGRDIWQQLLHEANWQLYVKDGAKYK